jgi:hypothetical protein
VKNIGASLILFRSLIRISEINLEDTFARCEKYSSKLDIISLAYSYLCKNKLQISALAKRAKAFSYKKTVWKNISYPLENIAQ